MRGYLDHRVPVAVDVALVGNLAVADAADGIHQELVTVPAVVERVDDDAQVVVLPDVAAIPPHVVGDDAVRLTVVAAGGDIEVVAVGEEPDLRPLGRRFTLARLLLDEGVDRGRGLVDRVVERTVDAQRHGDGCRADRDAAVGVAHVHGGRRAGRFGGCGNLRLGRRGSQRQQGGRPRGSKSAEVYHRSG